ncbi:MAG: pyridoxamine 5'-phosphate oxidase family protein [Alphaproteobacteria bacterium]|nr:pyridoxamine 5'-phosphate oxidase family protein [Alphaproteobacteria bacterium]
MAKMTLGELSKKMALIDFAMLSTRTKEGAVSSRPMSSNGEVEFTGDSFFFTDESSRMVAEMTADENVGLTFTGAAGILGGPPMFIAMEGEGELIRDKAQFAQRWTKGLDHWFKQGVDTPGLVLIKVQAQRIHYWNGADEGEIAL